MGARGRGIGRDVTFLRMFDVESEEGREKGKEGGFLKPETLIDG